MPFRSTPERWMERERDSSITNDWPHAAWAVWEARHIRKEAAQCHKGIALSLFVAIIDERNLLRV